LKNIIIFFLYFIIIVIFKYTVQAQTNTFSKIDFPQDLNIKDLEYFSEGFKKTCSKNFYRRLKNNKYYPQFGTVNSWEKICSKIKKERKIDLNFLKRNFFSIRKQTEKGVLTGYYEPEINISNKKTDKFKYPLLKKTNNLEYERKHILKKYSVKDVLYWTDNNIDLFFLHIQGSGVGVLPNGKRVKLAYAGNNGFKYTSIGKILIRAQEINEKNISLQSIKNWLEKNPTQIESIFNYNKRFIFFKEDHESINYPKGAMNIELIPKISIAIDDSIYPYGLPFVLNLEKQEYNKFVLAHDTGSAIKGYNRADLFIGSGEASEEIAGNLKEFLQLYVLVPYN
tara:strand:- start:124 stop:1140 length:1017 start_codon:yes stop_codon:yes gene_type:complete